MGCNSPSSPTQEEGPDFGDNNPDLIVALGDSITFGYGDMGNESCGPAARGRYGFCPRLSALSGKTVINEGICGEESRDGVRRVRGVLLSWKPGVLLIDYSPNDLPNNLNSVVNNLRIMIRTAKELKTVPVIGTLVPSASEHDGWNPFIEALNSKIRSLGVEEGIQVADHWQAFLAYPGYAASPSLLLTKDGLHPNSTGYALMAQTWNNALLKIY